MGMTIKDPQVQLQWLNTVLDSITADTEAQERSYYNTFATLVTQLESTSNPEQLRNLKPAVDRFSQKMDTLGYGHKYKVDSHFKTKENVFGPAEKSFEKALNIAKSREYDSVTDPDGKKSESARRIAVDNATYKQVAEKVNELGSDLYNIDLAIQEGNYIYRPKAGDERFTAFTLKEAMLREHGTYKAKMNLLMMNEEVFTIDDNGDGKPDIEQTAFYEQMMSKVLSGDIEGFDEWFDSNITSLNQKFWKAEKMYLSWKDVFDQLDPDLFGTIDKDGNVIKTQPINLGKITSGSDASKQKVKNEISGKTLYGGGEYAEVTKQQYLSLINNLNVSVENAKKYNSSHKLLTKEHIDPNPFWQYDRVFGKPHIIPGTDESITAKQIHDVRNYIKNKGF